MVFVGQTAKPLVFWTEMARARKKHSKDMKGHNIRKWMLCCFTKSGVHGRNFEGVLDLFFFEIHYRIIIFLSAVSWPLIMGFNILANYGRSHSPKPELRRWFFFRGFPANRPGGGDRSRWKLLRNIHDECTVSQVNTPCYCWWKKSCTSWYGKYPIICRVLAPSQVVVWDFWTINSILPESWLPWHSTNTLQAQT